MFVIFQIRFKDLNTKDRIQILLKVRIIVLLTCLKYKYHKLLNIYTYK